MFIRKRRVTLPERNGIPKTDIYVELIFNNETSALSEDQIRPVVIMLAGGPGGNHTVYNDIKAQLAEMADLVLWDPRGCGENDESDALYCTIDHYVDDIEALRAGLKINKPIIMGGSYGAMAALGYAIRYPDNLSGLLCIAGAANGGFIEKARENLKKYNATDEQIALAEKLFSGVIESADQMSIYFSKMRDLYVFNKSVFNDAGKAPTVAAAVSRSYPIDIVNAGYCSDGFLHKFNWLPNLCRIKVSTCLIYGECDWINDPSIGDEIAVEINKGAASVELIKIPNCGHFQWMDNPSVIELYKQFFLKCTPSKTLGLKFQS